MDSYGNGKEIIAFLWIPMDSHGNGRQIIGFLWIPMEMVSKSLDLLSTFPSAPSPAAPASAFHSPALSLSISPQPPYFLSIKSRKGEEVWRRGGVPEYPKTLKMLRKTKGSRQRWIGRSGGPSTPPSDPRHFAIPHTKIDENVPVFQLSEVRKPL